MIPRTLNISKNHSFFLFGARGTGKTSLLESIFNKEDVYWVNLLKMEESNRYEINPDELEMIVDALPKNVEWIVIDEIQKVPKLLDTVHRLIKERGWKFALTGSSAKKLKAGGANLLAGRAFVYELYPFTSFELEEKFDLFTAIRFGTLPGLLTIQNDDEKIKFLDAYSLVYLKEEIWNEHLVRNLGPFRKFLQIAAQCSGELINYSKIARDVNVDYKTVQQYFSIIEETLLGHFLEPFHHSVRKRQRQSPKFYFFDNGVKAALDKTIAAKILPQSFDFGLAFEQFVINEIYRLNSYLNKHYTLSFLRINDNLEIDLVIERPGMPMALVEIKSTDHVTDKHLESLKEVMSDFPKAEFFCFSRDNTAKKTGKIMALPWQRGIGELGLI